PLLEKATLLVVQSSQRVGRDAVVALLARDRQTRHLSGAEPAPQDRFGTFHIVQLERLAVVTRCRGHRDCCPGPGNRLLRDMPKPVDGTQRLNEGLCAVRLIDDDQRVVTEQAGVNRPSPWRYAVAAMKQAGAHLVDRR